MRSTPNSLGNLSRAVLGSHRRAPEFFRAERKKRDAPPETVSGGLLNLRTGRVREDLRVVGDPMEIPASFLVWAPSSSMPTACFLPAIVL